MSRNHGRMEKIYLVPSLDFVTFIPCQSASFLKAIMKQIDGAGSGNQIEAANATKEASRKEFGAKNRVSWGSLVKLSNQLRILASLFTTRISTTTLESHFELETN